MSHAQGADLVGYQLKLRLFNHAAVFIEENPTLGRFIGFPLTVAEHAITFAFSIVGQVVEPIFKGFAHMIMAPFDKRYNFLLGVDMLLFRFPAELIQSVSMVAIGVFYLPINACAEAIKYGMDPSLFHHKNQATIEDMLERAEHEIEEYRDYPILIS